MQYLYMQSIHLQTSLEGVEMLLNTLHEAAVTDTPSSWPSATVAGLEFLKRVADGSYPAPPFAAETDIWIVEAEQARPVRGHPSKRF